MGFSTQTGKHLTPVSKKHPRRRFVDFLRARTVPITDLSDDDSYGVGIPEDTDDDRLRPIALWVVPPRWRPFPLPRT